MKHFCHILGLALVTNISASAAVTEASFTASSLLGGTNDSVRGVRSRIETEPGL
jgi:hypothetical protein